MRHGVIALLALLAGIHAAGAQDHGGDAGAIADRLRGLDERLGEINLSNTLVMGASVVAVAVAVGATIYYAKQLRKQLVLAEDGVRYRLRPVLAWTAPDGGAPIGVYGGEEGHGGLVIRLVNAGQVSAEEIVAHLDSRIVGAGAAPRFKMRRLGALGPGESAEVRIPMSAEELGGALGGGMAYVEARFQYRGGGSWGLKYHVAGYVSGTLSTLFGVADAADPPDDAGGEDAPHTPDREAPGAGEGDAPGAAAMLEESEGAIAANPKDAAAHLDRASALRALGRTAEALGAARRAREISPVDVKALHAEATLLAELGRYEEAIGAMRRVVEKGEGSVIVEREMVRLHTMLGQHESAYHALSRIAAQEPSLESYMTLAERCMILRWYGSAIPEFGNAIDIAPEMVSAHLGRGMAQMNSGRYREAAATYRMAIRLDPGSAGAHEGLAYALYGLGQEQEAREEFRLAAEADPGSQQIHVGRGVILLEMGRREVARGAFAEARRLDPSMLVPEDTGAGPRQGKAGSAGGSSWGPASGARV